MRSRDRPSQPKKPPSQIAELSQTDHKERRGAGAESGERGGGGEDRHGEREREGGKDRQSDRQNE